MSINSESYWQVPMSSIAVNGTSVSISTTNFVFDSGSSLTYVPSADYRRLTAAMNSSPLMPSCILDSASGITFCDCTSINDARYPELMFNMGYQYSFYLKGSEYLIYESSRKKCIFTFIEDSSGLKFWLGGDPFFRAYVIVHDMDA